MRTGGDGKIGLVAPTDAIGEIDGRLHFLACPHSDGLGLAVVSIMMESAVDTFTADKLAALDLKLQQHLRLPALLVLVRSCTFHPRQEKKWEEC